MAERGIDHMGLNRVLEVTKTEVAQEIERLLKEVRPTGRRRITIDIEVAPQLGRTSSGANVEVATLTVREGRGGIEEEYLVFETSWRLT
jgi:hypothetical protein